MKQHPKAATSHTVHTKASQHYHEWAPAATAATAPSTVREHLEQTHPLGGERQAIFLTCTSSVCPLTWCHWSWSANSAKGSGPYGPRHPLVRASSCDTRQCRATGGGEGADVVMPGAEPRGPAQAAGPAPQRDGAAGSGGGRGLAVHLCRLQYVLVQQAGHSVLGARDVHRGSTGQPLDQQLGVARQPVEGRRACRQQLVREAAHHVHIRCGGHDPTAGLVACTYLGGRPLPGRSTHSSTAAQGGGGLSVGELHRDTKHAS